MTRSLAAVAGLALFAKSLSPIVAKADGRAALLVQGDPRPDAYTGDATWSADDGRWKATVNVPRMDFHATLIVAKNADRTLAAEYTMELRFEPASTILMAIDNAASPTVRAEEKSEGDAIPGAIGAKITPTFYLVALPYGRGPAQAFERLLEDSPSWIDIPMRLADQRVAKLTIEVGSGGRASLHTALQSWGVAMAK